MAEKYKDNGKTREEKVGRKLIVTSCRVKDKEAIVMNGKAGMNEWMNLQGESSSPAKQRCREKVVQFSVVEFRVLRVSCSPRTAVNGNKFLSLFLLLPLFLCLLLPLLPLTFNGRLSWQALLSLLSSQSLFLSVLSCKPNLKANPKRSF